MAHRFICAALKTFVGPVKIGEETEPVPFRISAVFDPERQVDPEYNGRATLQGTDPSGTFYTMRVANDRNKVVQCANGVWEGDIVFKVLKESQPNAVTAGIYAYDKVTQPNVMGDTYPWVTISIAK